MIALPAELENAPSQSKYLSAGDVAEAKPARVILGSYGRAKTQSLRRNASTISMFHSPPMSDGSISHRRIMRWRGSQSREGTLRTPEQVTAGELVVFEESNGDLVIQADSALRFVLGSAAQHPHDLVLVCYSVHTAPAALAAGESEI